MDVLSVVEQYDFYHLPGYHQLHEDSGKGALVVFREGEKIIALPLLVRKISSIPGLEKYTDCFDATSVYGYAGPVANKKAASDQKFLNSAREAFFCFAKQRNWVTVFSRLHPVLKDQCFLVGLGETVKLGSTVGIDLSLPYEQQRANYRKDHKYGINKLRRQGVTVRLDKTFESLHEFVEIYHETMKRVGADKSYFFPYSYFSKLCSLKNGCAFHLFLCNSGDRIVSGGLFSECNQIIQYHLSGTITSWLRMAPMKLIIDEVRLWANQRSEMKYFHLGGGVGSAEDSLFRFKAGFSPMRFPFHIWRWIVQHDLYRQLVDERRRWYEKRDENFPENDFFPAYRQ